MAISVGDAVLKLGVDTRDLARGMKGIGATIKKHQRAIGIGMTALGGTIVGGFALALKSASTFETAMREVNTLLGLSEDEFAVFSKDVLSLASNLGVDAVESAQALYQAISAGIPRENVLSFLEIATKAAIGGVTSTEIAVDGLTTVINAFKLPMSEAQKVADIMFTTVKGGKTTMEELSASMFQVAPVAAASGVSFEQVSAALVVMTKQGVPTRVATTQLRQAMVALQKPTEDMNKVIMELGFSSGQAMVEELGLAETLNILREATSGSNEMLLKMFGSVEAGQAVLSLTGDNMADFVKELEAMENSTGAATDAFDVMEQSASRQMEALKASFKGIAITVGTVLLPILKQLLDGIMPVIDGIRKWVEENPGLTKTLVIVVGVLGSLLLVLGPLLIMLPGIIAALPLLGVAFTLAMGPIGLAILAIAALVTGGILLIKNWDMIAAGALRFWGNIKSIFKAGVNFLIGLIEGWANAHIKAANIIIGALNSIKISIPDWVPVIGGKSFGVNIPKIPEISLPRLEQGGIAMRPMVASIAEKKPEAVIPLDRLGAMMGGRTVNITVELDGRVLMQAIGEPLVDEIRLRTGVRL